MLKKNLAAKKRITIMNGYPLEFIISKLLNVEVIKFKTIPLISA